MTPTPDLQVPIERCYRGPFAATRPIRDLTVPSPADRDGQERRLTVADLVALTPLLQPRRPRLDTPASPVTFFDPQHGLTRLRPPQVHAVRLPRAFRIETTVGAVHGAEEDYLLITGTGAISAVSEPELLARYEPLCPPIDSDELPPWAARTAAGLLGPIGDRWRHTVTAARNAERLAAALPTSDRPLLIAAAWLHDIGYAPALAATGLHHLDAALTLDLLVPPRLVGLIAHHTAADAEAELRHMSIALGCFPRERSPLSDALTYCDLGSGPGGRPMEPAERIDEAIARHGPGHVVARALHASRSDLLAACARAARRDRGSRSAGPSTARRPGHRTGSNLLLDPVEIIRWLCDRGLLVKDIAAALGTRSNRICEWRSGARYVSPRAYTMLTTLRDTVAEADRHLARDDTLRWLRAINPALDGQRPLDLIRSDGNRVRDAARRFGADPACEVS